MTTIRPPAVAGLFYPADKTELHRMISYYLDMAQPHVKTIPKAIIAPHAGYIYSGQVAANAYKCLQKAHADIHRVILLGPSHYYPLQGLASLSVDYLETPLGQIAVDHDALKRVENLPQVQIIDVAHQKEHSLEVQLPFLQMLLDDFTVVPLVVGQATPVEVAEVLNAYWGDDATLYVISSDLSHYYDYLTAQNMDQSTSAAIEALQPENVGDDSACGRMPIRGLLAFADEHHLHATTVTMCNSGDTAGDKQRVVGYGAYHFS